MRTTPVPKKAEQCKYCYFSGPSDPALVVCNHKNQNDPNDSKICYDYVPTEDVSLANKPDHDSLIFINLRRTNDVSNKGL